MIGIFSGIIIVICESYIQRNVSPDKKGRILGVFILLSWVGIAFGNTITTILPLTVQQEIFGAFIGLFVLAITTYIYIDERNKK